MPQDIVDLDHIASMLRVLTRNITQITTFLLPVAYSFGTPRERFAIRRNFPEFKPGIARHDTRGSVTLTKNRARELVIEFFDQSLPDGSVRWKGTSRDIAIGMQNLGLLPPGIINRGACVAIGKVLSILTSQSNCVFFSDVIRAGQPRLFEVWRNPNYKPPKFDTSCLERLAVESEHELIEFDKANKAFNVVSDKTAEEAAVPPAPTTRREMPPEKVAALLKLLPEPEEHECPASSSTANKTDTTSTSGAPRNGATPSP